MKIVILGSCRVGPYEIIKVPEKETREDGTSLWNTEEGYRKAFEKFKKAIDQADEVWIYMDAVGEHTLRDIEYVKSLGKKTKLVVDETYVGSSVKRDQEGGILRD